MHVNEIHNTGVAGVQARNKVKVSAKKGMPLSMYYMKVKK